MNELLANPTLYRLGLTVLHALWELLVLGLLIWVGLVALRRQTSAFRYSFACTGLLLMVAAPLLTFSLIGSMPGVGADLAQIEGGALLLAPLQGSRDFRDFLLQANAWVPWLAVLWSLGAAAMVARLGGGIWWLERAYRTRAHPAPESWQGKLNRMARRMGLNRPVRLLESLKADTPLVIGWFRPVILVPTSALLHLSTEALEAVLAHELAHIRRLDYLANLLQCCAEALLFFHPAVWWLSGRIRELREHCCDDAAVKLCGDPMMLAEGLSVLERLRRPFHSDPEPALAAAKGKLMSRITRLFQPQDLQAPSLRGLAMALVGASLLGISTLAAQKPTPTSKPAALSPQPNSDSEGVVDLAFSKVRIVLQPKAPAYPAEAKAKRIQGTVVISLVIDEKGVPLTVKALEGPEALQLTAIEYAKAWRFEPAKVKGKPVKARFKLTMPFRLSEHDKASPKPDEAADFDFSRIKILFQPPAPKYPAEAKEQKIQGTVVVAITIDEQGVPQFVEALEGPAELRPTAIDYAKAWRFEPAKVNGKPVKARFKLTMPFELR